MDKNEVGFSSKEAGLFMCVDGQEQRISSGLKILGKAADNKGMNPSYVLRLKPLIGPIRLIELPLSFTPNAARVEELLTESGVEIQAGCRRHVLRYIHEDCPARFFIRSPREGWVELGKMERAYVIGEKAFSADGETGDVLLGTDVVTCFAQDGNEVDWLALTKLCKGNPLMVFSMCAAFSSALLLPLGFDAGFVMFVGPSSTGKTTLLRLASALYTHPDRLSTWEGTANGIEAEVLHHSDMPMALDEIGQCDINVLEGSAYRLTNAASKLRATASGALAATSRPRTVILSSGEAHAVDLLRAAGKTVKTGQVVRFISIPVDEPYGAFTNLHGEENSAAFVKRIDRSIRGAYGHAWPAYVTYVAENQASFPSQFDDVRTRLQKRIGGEFAIDSDDGIIARVFDRFAMTAFAGFAAIKSGAVAWREEDVVAAVCRAFGLWRTQYLEQTTSPDNAFINDLRHFLRVNHHRFPPISDYENSEKSTSFGFAARRRSNESVFYILPESMHKQFGKGMTKTDLDRALRQSGYLIADNRPTKQIHIPGMDNVKMSFYVIRQSILSD
ncbi:MAG: DUF927 domain-containing protein [Collimonas sp.]|uniref:DUF927 domain-containing protein n=1 Tax=Collimonas sp. TaxID=1963772 RepID=UPI0032676D39